MWTEFLLGNLNAQVRDHEHLATERQATDMPVQDPNISQVIRKVMDVIRQRLSSEYMHLGEEQPGHPALRQISQLSKRTKELIEKSPIPTE